MTSESQMQSSGGVVGATALRTLVPQSHKACRSIPRLIRSGTTWACVVAHRDADAVRKKAARLNSRRALIVFGLQMMQIASCMAPRGDKHICKAPEMVDVGG